MIYLLHSTTSPLSPRARDAMLPILDESPDSPGGLLSDPGARRHLLDEARMKVSRFLGGGGGAVIFTSGGTEACNAALKGVAFARMVRGGTPGRRRILVAATEHMAVLYPARTLGKLGYEVVELPVDRTGLVDRNALDRHLEKETLLVSIALANGETGTIQPIPEIARQVHEAGALLHTDACIAAQGIDLDSAGLDVDLISISGHKLGGPQGTGALYVREGVRMQPLIEGGVNEGGRRGGMENLAGIVGLAEVVSAKKEGAGHKDSPGLLGERLLALLLKVPGVALNGHPARRTGWMVNVSAEGVDGEALLNRLALRGIAVSSGSSCFTESGKPSHVLLAMGLGESRASSSLLFSLGPGNTAEEIERTAMVFAESVASLRALAIPDAP